MDFKRKAVAGVAGVAVLAGAGGVYAATKDDGDKERKAFSDDVAKRLDVSPDKLNEAVQGAFRDRLDAAVKAGKLTQKEADAIEQKVKEHGGVPFGPPGFGPGGPDGPGEMHFREHHGGGLIMAGGGAAAEYLGLSQAQLEKRLMSGKSLADVAKAEGKSTDGLKKAIRAALEAKLDKAVKNDDLTAKQKTEMLKGFDARIDDMIAGKPPKFEKGMKRHFEERFDGPGGPPKPPPGAPGGPGSFVAPAPPPPSGI
jgi:hypothetical protein